MRDLERRRVVAERIAEDGEEPVAPARGVCRILRALSRRPSRRVAHR
ncbi:hypothetical protein [Luethyella okanaganae]|uniref:Uncharacterized protein n=1 Tax=Luethyella okanaganae TaxID=69372 RepID=A0ABW1VL13_9MICO